MSKLFTISFDDSLEKSNENEDSDSSLEDLPMNAPSESKPQVQRIRARARGRTRGRGRAIRRGRARKGRGAAKHSLDESNEINENLNLSNEQIEDPEQIVEEEENEIKVIKPQASARMRNPRDPRRRKSKSHDLTSSTIRKTEDEPLNTSPERHSMDLQEEPDSIHSSSDNSPKNQEQEFNYNQTRDGSVPIMPLFPRVNIEENLKNNPLTIPPKFENGQSKIYNLRRNVRNFHSVIEFVLYDDRTPVFYAITKGIIKTKTNISFQTDSFVDGACPEFVLMSTFQMKDFFLHYQNEQGPILLSVCFVSNDEEYIAPRSLNICSAEPILNLTSLKPKFNEKKGTWQLDFGGKFAIKSSKNYVLIDKNHNVSIVIRKITDDSIEIETFLSYFPIVYLAAIGIADFLSPID